MDAVTLNDISSASIGCKFVAIVGLFYIVICAVLAVYPEYILSRFDWASETGRYVTVILDLVFGIAFVWAARSSRLPEGFNLLGAMLLLGAVFYFLIPLDMWVNYLNWWLKEQLVLTRVLSGLFGIPFGVLIVFGAIGPSESVADEST